MGMSYTSCDEMIKITPAKRGLNNSTFVRGVPPPDTFRTPKHEYVFQWQAELKSQCLLSTSKKQK